MGYDIAYDLLIKSLFEVYSLYPKPIKNIGDLNTSSQNIHLLFRLRKNGYLFGVMLSFVISENHLSILKTQNKLPKL